MSENEKNRFELKNISVLEFFSVHLKNSQLLILLLNI